MARWPAVLLVGIVVSAGFGQRPSKPAPGLTKELADRVSAGKGKLTQEEVAKILPGSYRAVWPGSGRFSEVSSPDAILVWGETTQFEGTFLDGKLTGLTAEWTETAESALLTPANYRQVHKNATRDDLEKLLGKPEWYDFQGKDGKVGWIRGREIVVFIKDDKVVFAAFKEYKDK